MRRSPQQECCICMVLKSTRQLIYQPCKLSSHKICRACIKKIIHMMPISEERPHILCQSPFEECSAEYNSAFIKKILKERYCLYEEASNSYKYEGCKVLQCKCKEIIYVPYGDILDTQGHNIFSCWSCGNIICIDCDMSVDANASHCVRCINRNTYTNAYSINYFFNKEGNKSNLIDYKLKNYEVTIDTAVKQLTEKFNYEDLYVKCPVCNIYIKKTESCNGVKHCHVEICYSCGMFSNIGEDLKDHWSARGHRGCPRWDNDIFWNSITTIKCSEDICYNHTSGDCKIPEHQDSIKDIIEYRKKLQMYHSLKSLIPIVRYKIIIQLPDNLKKYIPPMWVWDILDTNDSVLIRQHYDYADIKTIE